MSHEETLWIILVAVSMGEALTILGLLLATRLASWWAALVSLAQDGWYTFHDRFLVNANDRQIAQIHAIGEATRRELDQLYREYLHTVLHQPKGR